MKALSFNFYTHRSAVLMLGADVSNDLFDAGAADNHDGAAVANLTYRITALYSGRDAVLGASAGLKHFMIDATMMRQVLKGLDRDVLVDRKIAPPPKS